MDGDVVWPAPATPQSERRAWIWMIVAGAVTVVAIAAVVTSDPRPDTQSATDQERATMAWASMSRVEQADTCDLLDVLTEGAFIRALVSDSIDESLAGAMLDVAKDEC